MKYPADCYSLISPVLRSKVGLGYCYENSIGGCNLIQITNKAPLHVKETLERIALYFKREFGYDFVQYSASEKLDIKDAAYIFVEREFDEKGESFRVLGGAVFRHREYTNHAPETCLQWIWLHPVARNRGILGRAWPYLLHAHGNFRLEGPISPSMQMFVHRRANGKTFAGYSQNHVVLYANGNSDAMQVAE